jgi:chromosomal replication initiator protein
MTRDFPYEKFLNNKTNKNEDLLNNIFNEKPLNSREIHSANAALSVKDSVDNSVDSCAEISAFKPIEDALFSLLSAQIDQLKFTTFIENKIKLVSFSNNLAKFKAQTSFIQTTIENSFKVQIENCLETLMGEKYSLVFEERDGETLPPVPALKGSLSDLLENNQKSAPMPTSSSTKSSMQKKTSFTLDLTPTKEELTEGIESKFIDHMTSESLGFAIDPNKTFDNFIVGPSNNLAFATACAVSDSPGKTGKYPCLYLYSDSGLGKTHLLHAVANGIFENHTDLSVCLISARDFMKVLIKTRSYPNFKRNILRVLMF